MPPACSPSAPDLQITRRRPIAAQVCQTFCGDSWELGSSGFYYIRQERLDGSTDPEHFVRLVRAHDPQVALPTLGNPLQTRESRGYAALSLLCQADVIT